MNTLNLEHIFNLYLEYLTSKNDINSLLLLKVSKILFQNVPAVKYFCVS